MPEAVLVVEDDPGHRSLLDEELTDAGYVVHAVASAEEAFDALGERSFALVVSDLRLPGADGFAVLERARTLVPAPGVIMLTGFGTIDQAVHALKAGADDFLTKPVDLEHLCLAADRVLQTRRLRAEVQQYREALGDHGFHGMHGRSPAMLRLFELIRRIARSDGSVLVTGESGTGKELVARALHEESPRAGGPFVAINCAGIPETLLESELLGHAAGAFSGARGARKGLFLEADGGTLFLDEIGEMPPAMQTKLLRLLQDGRVRPVGSNDEVASDVRIVAATHRDLAELLREGHFREDLFYRLETFRIEVPPLRERGEDIERLVFHFLRRQAAAQEVPLRGLAPEALRMLLGYRFPGNVRELTSLVERAATLAQGEVIQPEDLPERVCDDPGNARAVVADPAAGARDEEWYTLEELEARYIRQVLAHTGGNKQRAARILGIGRKTLYRKLGGDL
ncbi:two component, sigma54 specific, transcriptional regulator, Fis family - like protein [Thioalkalivibrio nitratireducens DSM 14787]|uniref:Two component, sigma54 specific, transcriptional regulator, Fis family-like protein n=1 Tax=Thioalkalivibrio nitratireducens (strain DSM 14787 / UNIQEM 213 / ALEN2) TaxID=1255043 RepID=L0E0P9_THIND|nr:two component, sigma54 specific, transcriptional regulator, Fis family - like protein [Thioalkalivibrio nitratireducens DSM 14787]